MKQKFVLITLLFVILGSAKGQEKVYYDTEGNITNEIGSAVEYRITEKSLIGSDSLFKKTTYFISGLKKSENSLLKVFTKRKIIDHMNTGEKWEWFENGSTQLKAFYKDGQLQGEFCTYWPSGLQRRKDIYDNGKLIEGNCYDSTGNKISKYFPYEKMPEFPGGDQKLFNFLGSNTHYPVEAAKNGIQGRVILQFYVGTDGKITDIKIVRKVNDYLDMEALRVVRSMPEWTPGEHEGQKVRVKYTLPVSFRMQ